MRKCKTLSKVLTQKQILKLLKAGVYFVDEDPCKEPGGQPILVRASREVGKWFYEDGRAWVRLYWQGRRKMILFARLVWMSRTLCVVPKDFEIHHDDLDRRNDRWDNLICLHKLDHRKVHEHEDLPF